MEDETYYVYIMASRSRVLYVGMTCDLHRRVNQHRTRTIPGFTRKYSVTRLVHLEATSGREAALTWERVLKGWGRARKVALIESRNPEWRDRSAEVDGEEAGRKTDSSLRSE